VYIAKELGKLFKVKLHQLRRLHS